MESIKHKSVCLMRPVVNQASIVNEKVLSPPHKRIRDTHIEVIQTDFHIEEVLDSMKNMEVDEKFQELKLDEIIPDRLANLLQMKGLNIKEHKLQQVGGGGRCGATVFLYTPQVVKNWLLRL